MKPFISRLLLKCLNKCTLYMVQYVEKAYEELFKIVKQHVKRKPNYLSIDFEKAAENSFGVTYPECEIFGCFFHFKQCIWRQICVSLFGS